MQQGLRKGDIAVVWKLDRLSRPLKDLLLTLEKIKEVGADFQSLTEAIDTSTPAGRMMMQIVGSFAEFERAMLWERTKNGLEAARQEGRVGGRRPKLTPQQQKKIITFVTSGQKTGAERVFIKLCQGSRVPINFESAFKINIKLGNSQCPILDWHGPFFSNLLASTIDKLKEGIF